MGGTRFEIPESFRLRILTVSGKVFVTGEERSDGEIDPGREAHYSDKEHAVEFKSRSNSLRIRVPIGMNVSVGTVSGDVTLDGGLGTVKVSTVSSKVRVGRTSGDADIRSISGDIVVVDCGGRCRATSKSGSIALGHVAGAVKAHTMSGSVEIGTAGQDEVEIKTISGRIEVKVDHGRSPKARLKSLSGRCRCEIESGADFEIRASSLSGSIEVQER